MPHKAPDYKDWLEHERELHGLTQLPDLEDFTEHFGELDGAAAEGALVFVFPAAVLQDDLWGARTGRVRAARREARSVASGLRRLARSLYPDVGVLMDFSQV